MANTTQYTDDQAAHALAVFKANGGNAKKTAAMLGIPRSTLRAWVAAGQRAGMAQQAKVVPAKLVSDKSQQLADMFEHVLTRALNPGEIDEALVDASFKDRMIGAGIATQNRQLLIGAPTSRNESLSVTLVAQGTLNELGDRTLSALKGRNT